ncbi:MAG: glycosyltransferase family 9 protein [Flavobacteriales bacterium]|nr:glycosyltransferase family 9 protein [Flavobacteriales bacterium]
MPKQFLIIQTAFLGDAVLATGLAEKLHAWYPDAAIDLVVRKGNDGLFKGHPFLRKLHVWDKSQGKNRDLFRLVHAFRRQRYDHVINAQRFFSTGLMAVLSGGKETVGYDKNPLSLFFSRRVKHEIPDWRVLRGKAAGTGVHEMDRLNVLIEHLTDGKRPLPRLYPSEADRAQVAGLLGPQGPEAEALREQPTRTPAGSLGEDPADIPPQGPEAETLRERSGAETLREQSGTRTLREQQYITIAPASVWYTKQWPAGKWIELIQLLPPEQRVLLIGAPGDVTLCDHIAKEAGRGEVLAGKLSLLATAALMEGAIMNYVNDSAPLHIASAMNAPVTAIFCSTVPAFGFGPLRPNGRIVQREETLYCRPCGLHGHKACPEGHFKCALEVLPTQLAAPMP